ncbi:gluconolactonase precursor [mine drainage metagenome]|uniref:Gluconolactonase n=1 Tax=mine drainage metagenome TaxID=410659 RepID=A0A1J5PTN8_9ZZZZ
MNRRAFLASSAATATAAATMKLAAAATVPLTGETGDPLPVPAGEQLPLGPLAGSRYPDSHIESLDKRFKGSPGTGAVERVATGFRWAEGPAYFRAGRYLIFSDIPNNRQMRLTEDDNHLSVFRSPSYNSNGNTVDRQGRLISCQHGGWRVVRTEFDGTMTIIADSYNGKKLNSPNDVILASDDSIWFSDPSYGIGGNYEGLQAPQEQAKHNVFRVDPKSGEIKVVVDDFVQPNGLAFSPDEKKLYIVESRAQPNRLIWAYDVGADGSTLSNKTKLIDANGAGAIDGIKVDTDGNIWCGWGSNGAPTAKSEELDGVKVFNPEGKAIGFIRLPERCPNLVFGGPKKNRLFMASSHSLYALYVEARGAV